MVSQYGTYGRGLPRPSRPMGRPYIGIGTLPMFLKIESLRWPQVQRAVSAKACIINNFGRREARKIPAFGHFPSPHGKK